MPEQKRFTAYKPNASRNLVDHRNDKPRAANGKRFVAERNRSNHRFGETDADWEAWKRDPEVKAARDVHDRAEYKQKGWATAHIERGIAVRPQGPEPAVPPPGPVEYWQHNDGRWPAQVALPGGRG